MGLLEQICNFFSDLEVFNKNFNLNISEYQKWHLKQILWFLRTQSFEYYFDFPIFLSLQIIIDGINDSKTVKDIITDVKEMSAKCGIPENEVIGIVSRFNSFLTRGILTF